MIKFLIEEHPEDKRRWWATNTATGHIIKVTSATKLFNNLSKPCVKQCKGMTEGKFTFEWV